MLTKRETIPQRSSEHARTRSGPHNRERFEFHIDGPRIEPFPQNNIDAKVFHHRVDKLFDGGRQTVDFIDKENRIATRVCQIRQQILGGSQSRARGDLALDIEFFGQCQSQCCLAQAGRTIELPVSLDPLGNGSLSLVIDPPETEVKLDGRAIGKGSVSQPTVVAGPHLLELSAPGYTPLQQSILIDAGAETRLALHLERAPGAALAATPEPKPKPPSEGLSRSQKLKVTGWSVGAVGLGVGIFGATRFAVSGAAYDEYVQRSASGPGPQSEVESIRDEQVVPARNLGVTLSTVGAAMLAGGLTMAVTF